MKKILFLCFLVLPLLTEAHHSSPDTIATVSVFEQKLDWAGIKAKAAQEGKYIFVDAFATWCMPCKVMDNTVYPNDSIQGLLRKKFVAVKIQMDKTENDPAYVKSWYQEAAAFAKTYSVAAYPTILIFTPEGKLVYNEAGAYGVRALYKLMDYATNPETAEMYAAAQEYKRGEYSGAVKLFSNKLDSLAFFVSRIIKERGLADSIAREYKEHLLQTASANELTSARNMEFIRTFPWIIASTDYYFKLCYTSPDRADKLAYKGWADFVVGMTITREELENKTLLNKKPVMAKPNWQHFASEIHDKYDKVDAEKLVLDFQIRYYRFYEKDWQKWAFYKNERITKYPPDFARDRVQAISELNDGGAWDLFLNCNDKVALKEGLNWIDRIIRMSRQTDSTQPYNGHAYFDTKANLLYKIGNYEEAIALEKEAINKVQHWVASFSGADRDRAERSAKRDISNYTLALAQMEKREPTNLNQGAIWNDETMPKKN